MKFLTNKLIRLYAFLYLFSDQWTQVEHTLNKRHYDTDAYFRHIHVYFNCSDEKSMMYVGIFTKQSKSLHSTRYRQGRIGLAGEPCQTVYRIFLKLVIFTRTSRMRIIVNRVHVHRVTAEASKGLVTIENKNDERDEQSESDVYVT